MYRNFVLDPGFSRTLRASLSPHRLAVIKNNTFKRHSSQIISQDKSDKLELTPEEKEEKERNAPIKYSISKAADSKAYYYRFGGEPRPSEEIKWYNQASLLLSYTIFIIYLFNREGNDLDKEFGMSLGERILKLQEFQLNLEKQDRLNDGGSTEDIDEEIEEVYRLRKEYNYIL